MSDGTDARLEYSVRVRAAAEVVFRHFTDPTLMVRWLGVRAVLDPRRDGRWSVDVNGVDVVAGTYLEIDPFTRLVFTWAWNTPAADPRFESIVEVDLHEEGEFTVVRLRHSGLPPELREGHDSGWHHYLQRLATAAAGDDPGPDPLATPATRHDARSR